MSSEPQPAFLLAALLALLAPLSGAGSVPDVTDSAVDPPLEAALEGPSAQARPGAPSDAAALSAARRALERDRPAEAVEILGRALEDHPGSAELHALMGRALGLADRFSEAAEHLESAVALGRDDLATLLFLGSAQWESRRIEAGEATLRRAARRGDEAAREGGAGAAAAFLAHHQLGRLLLWAGEPEEALPALERAVALDPGAFDARLDLARALDRAGRSERAVEEYRAVVRMAPGSPHARWGLGQALLALGEREEAAEHLAVYRELYAADQERTRNEQLQEAGLERARRLFEAGELDGAERVVRGLPETPATLEALARIRATGGDPAGAVEALERAVELAPDRDDLRSLLTEARLLSQEGAGESPREDGGGS